MALWGAGQLCRLTACWAGQCGRGGSLNTAALPKLHPDRSYRGGFIPATSGSALGPAPEPGMQPSWSRCSGLQRVVHPAQLQHSEQSFLYVASRVCSVHQVLHTLSVSGSKTLPVALPCLGVTAVSTMTAAGLRRRMKVAGSVCTASQTLLMHPHIHSAKNAD